MKHGLHALSESIFDRTAVTRWPWVAAALGWVAFSLYWEHAAKNSAEKKSAESRASRGVHVFLTNAALLLVIVPVRGIPRLLPASAPIMMAGLVVEAMGLGLAIQARRYLGRYWSGEISIKVDHQLVRSGPYRKLRHPIYTGLLAMYLGAATVALAGFAIAVLAYARKIRLEEVNLEKAFGAHYEAYRQESWALIPGLF
jgi:protein-S-isoprenylcysteine O-methyltransferase Ste14